ncbi:MAG: hypothetical protein IPM29_26680 [Planctomycetes bacterium]|nr:hypothetical protein [Planctomycetota bacterium]
MTAFPRRRTALLWCGTLLLPALALAQEPTGPAAPPATAGARTRVRIESELRSEQSMRTLVDGEERTFGGGRGGTRGGPGAFAGGPTVTAQTVVFDEPADPGAGRRYVELRATETRTGRDGTQQDTPIDGALAGRTVVRGIDDQGQDVLVAIDRTPAEELPSNLAQDVPHELDLGCLAPPTDTAAGGTFPLAPAFAGLVRSLLHPVVAAPPTREGRNGGAFGRGGFRGPRGGNAQRPWTAALASDALQAATLQATLVGDETRDGIACHRLALTARWTAAGQPNALGFGFGFGAFGGGRGGAPTPPGGGDASGEANLTIELDGSAWVAAATGRLVALELQAKLGGEAKSSRTLERGGESQQLETEQTLASELHLTLQVAPAGD